MNSNFYLPPEPEVPDLFSAQESVTPASPGVPHSREAEEAVIGSVLINQDAYYDIAQFLNADDFYIHRNKWIWESFIRLYERRSPVDLLTVSEELERSSQLVEIGGVAYLTSLINQVPTSLNAEAYGRIVEEHSIRRKMIASANKIASLAYAGGDVRSNYEKGKKAYDNAMNVDGEFRSMRDLVSGDWDRIQARARGEINDVIPTGKIDIDKMLDGGMRRGNLLYIGGRPGQGKTGLETDFALSAAESGFTVGIISLEMSNEQITQRLIAKAGIPMKSLRTGVMTEQQWDIYTRTIERYAMHRIFSTDIPAIRPSQLRAKAHSLYQAHGLDLLIIDYIQLMGGDGEGSNSNRNNELSAISRTCKVIARELNCAVVAGAQLSRKVEERSDKRPLLSDLRDSGSLEADADIVFFLYRDEYYNKDTKDKGIAEVNVAKQRDGETGMVKLRFDGPFMRFQDLETRRNADEVNARWRERADMGDD